MPDITVDELKQRLKLAEARQTLLQAVWETDGQGVVRIDSPSWRAYTGQTSEEWLGYGWLGATHPDDRAYAEHQWREAIAAHRLVDAEFRLRAPDGGWRWTNVRATPITDKDGNIGKWVGLNIDIEARKRAEDALREREATLRTVFDSMDEGFLIHEIIRDEMGRPVDIRMLLANPALTRLTGLGQDLIGKRQRPIMPELEQIWIDTFDRVARTGVPERFENYNEPTNRWYKVRISPVIGHDDQVAVIYDDITAQKHADVALRESEARQAFLLKLGDGISRTADPGQVRQIACQLLAEALGADRAYYVEFFPEEGFGIVGNDYAAPKLASLAGTYPFEAFRTTYERVAQGGAWVVPNVATSTEIAQIEASYYVQQSVIAWTNSPLLKDGRLRAVLCVVQTTPRQWTSWEVRLITETAERLWSAIEHARAETALRQSEERFRQFAEASSDVLWIRDAKTFAATYVSPAAERIYGTPAETLISNVEYLNSLVVPEDRAASIAQLETAASGDGIVREFRVRRPGDGAFRWIRRTAFPLQDQSGQIAAVAGMSTDVSEARQLADHRAVLLAELQHRVRNIMGVIRSICNRSNGGAATIEDYRQALDGRMLALARVQALLTRNANAGGLLREIIQREVEVQAHNSHQFELVGPQVMLSPKAVEVLTLALHELSTNALKYGAFSVPHGRLRVSWSLFEKLNTPWLRIDWVEAGAPPRESTKRRGFGSELIEARIPYELGGTGQVTIGPEGAQCRIEFPLRDAESILETDAPIPMTTYGGTIDMNGAPDLSGRIILVIEDDYYMAADTMAALQGAGAEVLGPCPTEDSALDLLKSQSPTHAVVDLNLGGGGPRFEVAHALRAKGIPFVFVTGYDPDIIPQDLAEIPRLQKPASFRSIVDALSLL